MDEVAPFDLWFKSKDSQYLYVNKRFVQAMGRNRNQLQHKYPADIFEGERIERVLALDKQVMEQGFLQRVIPCEESGVIKMHNEHRFALHSKTGEVSGLGCIALEVSEETFAQNTLARAESLAQLGSWRWSIASSDLISCSQEFANILGVTIGETFELMYHRLDRLIHPEDRHLVEPTLKSIKNGNHRSYKIEYRIIKRNGDIRHVVEIAEPLYNGDKAIEYVGILQDITERKSIENELRDIKNKLELLVEKRTEHLEYLVSHDSLTGLLNRSALTQDLEKLMPKVTDSHIALVLMDLDGFKDINDYFGHLVGDKTLVTIAERIKLLCGEKHFGLRLGGDEFAIVMPNISGKDEVESFCSNLLSHVCNSIEIAQIKLFVRCSIGYEIKSYDCWSLENMLANADLALYESKKCDEIKIVQYTDAMGQELSYRNIIEAELRKALAVNALHIEYQPKFALGDNPRIIGVEALARWHDKNLGKISPEQFIPIAEKTGMINELSDFVLDTACKDIASLNETFNLDLNLSVNFSAAQFFDDQLSNKITAAVEKSNLSHEKLEIEITETVFINNPDKTTQLLKDIRSNGVKVSLDDFGTGYSSLSYLKDYQVDILKLDRGFIKDLEASERSQNIVKNVINLADSLDLSVICEGIETQTQKNMIEQSGCKYGQGFLLGKPMPIESLQQLLDSKD